MVNNPERKTCFLGSFFASVVIRRRMLRTGCVLTGFYSHYQSFQGLRIGTQHKRPPLALDSLWSMGKIRLPPFRSALGKSSQFMYGFTQFHHFPFCYSSHIFSEISPSHTLSGLKCQILMQSIQDVSYSHSEHMPRPFHLLFLTS